MATKARLQLSADKRTVTGRKVKKLRREGLLPANVFGKKVKSLSLQLDTKNFHKVYQEVGETGLVDLTIAGESAPRPILITAVQQHPVTGLPLHADFRQVDLTQKVIASVPIEIIGESPAVKDKAAVLITLLDEIEVEALPADLPEKFEVDISGLTEFDQAILVKDLKVDRAKITLKVEDEAQVVMVQEHKEEVIAPTAEETAAAQAPAEGAAPAEAPAEGEAKPEEAKAEETKAEEPKSE